MTLPDRRSPTPTGIAEREGGNPNEFLAYLRAHVSIEMLLLDRFGQARLDHTLERKFSREKHPPHVYIPERARAYHRSLVQNPYPFLQFDTLRAADQPFMLKDGEYYYYFPRDNPPEETPPYLRPQDVVPSGRVGARYRIEEAMEGLGLSKEDVGLLMYEVRHDILGPYIDYVDIPFRKSINRIPITGGLGQRYNYNTKEWEANGDKWKMGFRRRVAGLVKSPDILAPGKTTAVDGVAIEQQ